MRLCAMQDLAEGEIRDFELEGRDLIVVWPAGGTPKAYDAACPHEGVSLAFGDLDGKTLVCGAHMWSFDAETGAGIFPGHCNLKAHRLTIEEETVHVDLDA